MGILHVQDIAELGCMKIKDVIQILNEIKGELKNEPEHVKDLSLIQYLLDKVFSRSRACEDVSLADFDYIKTAYKQRWDRVRFLDYGYTAEESLQGKWVTLARQLCENPNFACTYIELLMPTVNNLDEYEIVQAEKIKDLPLDELLLSEDGTKLMSLKTAIGYAKSKAGVLAVHQQGKEHVFTQQEQKRFQCSNPTLWRQYHTIRTSVVNDDGIRVTKSTIHKLIELIERSVFERGLYDVYSETEQDAAETAYYLFQEYLNTLNETEYANLMTQVIRRPFGAQCFKSIWSLGMRNDACITLLAKDICQLIIDYEPNYQFRNTTICQWVQAGNMRGNSRKKEYATHQPLKNFTDVESFYQQHLMRLLSLIMTRKFAIGKVGGKRVSYSSEVNTITRTAQNMLKRICTAFDSNQNYLETYFYIQNVLLFDALHNASYNRDADTQNWLLDVFFGKLFFNQVMSFELYLAKAIRILEQVSLLDGENKTVNSLRENILKLILNLDGCTPEQKILKASLIFAKSEELFKYVLNQRFLEVDDKAQFTEARQKSLDKALNIHSQNDAELNIINFFISTLRDNFCNKSSVSFRFFQTDSSQAKLQHLAQQLKTTKDVQQLTYDDIFVAVYKLLPEKFQYHWAEHGEDSAKDFVRMYTEINPDNVQIKEEDSILVYVTPDKLDDSNRLSPFVSL